MGGIFNDYTFLCSQMQEKKCENSVETRAFSSPCTPLLGRKLHELSFAGLAGKKDDLPLLGDGLEQSEC